MNTDKTKQDNVWIQFAIKNFRSLILIGILLVIIITFSMLTPYFFTFRNFVAIGLLLSIIGIISIGQTICMIAKGFDLSVGYVAQLGGIMVALLSSKVNVPFGLAIVISLLAAAIIGFVNGILITKVKMNSLIATLATSSIVGGLAYVLSNGYAIIVSQPGFSFLGKTKIFEIPLPVITLLLCYIVFNFIMKRTTYGRKVYCIGGNAEASGMAGIRIDRVKIGAYMISAVLSAFAGILLASRMSAAQLSAGQSYALNSVAAVILGGTGVIGGEGKIYGTLLGVLIIGILSNGLVMLGIDQWYRDIATGGVLILSFLVQMINDRIPQLKTTK